MQSSCLINVQKTSVVIWTRDIIDPKSPFYCINAFTEITIFHDQNFFPVLIQANEEDAGRIGLMIVVSGMVGSVISGFILDKTKRYK